MLNTITNYFLSLNSAGQILFVVGVLLIITFIILLIVVLKPEKNKVKKIYAESAITEKENDFEEKMKDIDNIGIDDININNDKTRNLKNIVDELKAMESKNHPTHMEIIEKYEDEQEDTAIISIEELLKNNNTFTYAKKEETPKPVIEEENLYDTSKISVAVPKKTEYYFEEIKEKPIPEVVSERKYTPTREIFSSVFSDNERPSTKKEEDSNEVFLNSLKEFRNNL